MGSTLTLTRDDLGWFSKARALEKLRLIDLNSRRLQEIGLGNYTLIILYDGEWGIVLKDEQYVTHGIGTLVAKPSD